MEVKINKHFEPLWDSGKRYNLSYGGRGSGKSFFMGQFFVLKCMEGGYFRGIMVREVLGDIRESQFREIVDYIQTLGVGDQFLIRQNTMDIIHEPTGNMIISKGLKKSAGNQTAKIKSIKDPSHIWIEEADEITYEDFVKLDTTIRTKKVKKVQMFLTFNPENQDSWIHSKWFIDGRPRVNPKDTLILHSTYKVNIDNLDKGYIAALLDMYNTDPDRAKVYVDGNWGGGRRGRVFTHFQVGEYMPEGTRFYGLDFGYSNDPCCLVRCVMKKNNLFVEELFYDKELKNIDIANKMKELGVGYFEKIYADSSEPKSIAELRGYGFNVLPCIKGKDSVNYGIQFLKQLKVFIMGSSKNLWHEVSQYVWEERQGVFLNKPKDDYNHGMDAIRYAVSTIYMRMKRGMKKLN